MFEDRFIVILMNYIREEEFETFEVCCDIMHTVVFTCINCYYIYVKPSLYVLRNSRVIRSSSGRTSTRRVIFLNVRTLMLSGVYRLRRIGSSLYVG